MRDRSASRGLRSRAIPVVLALVWATIAFTTGSPRASATDAVDPWTVKAHILRNFVKLVTWPKDRFEDKDSPIVIGVLGTDPFHERLDQAIAGRTAHGRSLQVRRLPVADGQLPATERLTDCHLLFVSGSERDRVALILERLGKASVMTVSDLDNFIASGGVAELVRDGPHIKFRLNRKVAEGLGLQLSVKMLTLALP